MFTRLWMLPASLLLCSPLIQAQESPTPKTAKPTPAPARNQPLGPFADIFINLDANADQVIERDEIPERGLPAFDRLLKRADLNTDGKLDVGELRALGDKLRPLTQAGQRRFQAMDRNGDGALSPEEFTGPPPLFDRIDADQNGAISREEARQAFLAGLAPGPRSAFGPGPNPPAGPLARRRFQTLDADQDGKLSREEFRGPAPLFDRLDTNQDGAVSQQEFQSGNSSPGPGPGPRAGRARGPLGPPRDRPGPPDDRPGRRLRDRPNQGDQPPAEPKLPPPDAPADPAGSTPKPPTY